jgi:hypothetical protein
VSQLSRKATVTVTVTVKKPVMTSLRHPLGEHLSEVQGISQLSESSGSNQAVPGTNSLAYGI